MNGMELYILETNQHLEVKDDLEKILNLRRALEIRK